MNDNTMVVGIININEYIKAKEDKINAIIKDASYAEIIRYLELLPENYQTEDSLFDWGFSYINEYYKIIGKLENMNSPEVEELKHKLYILYLQDNMLDISVTYDEFITFSKLLNVAFSDYKPNKTRKRDKESYKSGNADGDSIVNEIAYDVLHSPHPHAYEITKFNLDILLNILKEKKNTMIIDEFNKIDLDDSLLNSVLSQKRIKKLKEKKK